MKRRSLLKFLLSDAGAIALHGLTEPLSLSTIPPTIQATTWSYTGKTGTDFWGELDPEFQACDLGKAQSPIDLKSSVASDLGRLELDYRDTPLAITNNSRTIRVDYQPGSSLTLDGRRYELLQFHFHQPSEHLRSGQAFDMEAHFVHKNQDTGDLLVLAVLMQQGAVNQAINTIWQKLPLKSDRQSTISNLVINALQLLPENINRYYRYQGSLTTPPCLETVTWLILKQPIEVSRSQIAHFSAIIGSNARPVQALNQRTVSEFN